MKAILKFGERPKFNLDVNVDGKETPINYFTHCPHGIDVELWSMEIERRDMMRTTLMRSLVAMVVFLAGVGMVSAAAIKEELTFEGRFVRLIVPEHIGEGELLPLVLHLHGAIPLVLLTEDPADEELDASGYDNLPSKYKVIVAAPNGTIHPVLPNYFWNATEACCGFESVFGAQVDDAGFLIRLVDKLLATHPVDPKRVYIYGYSNGGFMANRMACDHAERFAAVAVGAGSTFNDSERCAPSSPVSVLHFHSLADAVVLFNGGNSGFVFGFPANPEFDYPGAIETVERWAALNGCSGELKFGKKPKFDLDIDVDGKETTVNRVTRCPHGIDVELWSMEGVDHPPLSFGVGPDGIKTLAKETWQFLRHHKSRHR